LLHWPPIPDPPVLNAISNPDGDGDYSVTWNAADRADTYNLQEDVSPAFSNPSTPFTGPGTSWIAGGKPVGLYYYRVKATNSWGDSAWSTAQSEDVSVPNGLITLAQQDFEGSFPGAWQVKGSSPYYWGQRNCRVLAGSYSGWAVGGGTSGGALGCGSDYPTNVESWMIYGPFSLQGATAANLTYQAWVNTEPSHDYLCHLASVDGVNFHGHGPCTSGYTSGWVAQTLDLSNVDTLGNLLGQPQVWVAVYFFSDSTFAYPEGAYIDNVVLQECTAVSCPPVTNQVSTSGNDRSVDIPMTKTRTK
jgi:hypothetical protein